MPLEPPTRNPVAVVRAQDIAGKLFADELVVRLVVVERLDDVITIGRGIFARRVLLEPGRLGEANNVEPMPRPPFAVTAGCEQALDEPVLSVRPFVRNERRHFLRRRRQRRDAAMTSAIGMSHTETRSATRINVFVTTWGPRAVPPSQRASLIAI